MTREIKFRAWHNQQNEWWYFTLSELIDAGNKNEIQKHAAFLKHRMQFTGLKDKNGKEIFEGDIVKHIDENLKVFFNSSMGSWDLEYAGGDCINLVDDHGWDSEDFEVIGNIHENPELLNQ